ncbi:uncharacterized protein LOC135844958 isoform X9 [Planococcus citri]|uniref:uncharacterized protein LOC135844958 isoform X9 n=1 Tax=Planococcus citri TaxID=170843 RepID=UPI0031F856D4
MNSDHALDFSKERPFSCLERPSSLQTLAASRIVERLWLTRYVVQAGYDHGCWKAGWPKSLRKWSMFSCRDMFAVPPMITDIIDEYIFMLGNEIQIWEDNLRKAVLQTSEHTVRNKVLVKLLAKCFECVIFKPNGDICFRSSARKILMLEELDIVRKFRIACQFCLENEIRQMWPSVSEMRNVFGNYTLIRYWENTLRNNLVAREPIVVEQLADSVQQANWAAFEYFWEMLSEERQTLEAITIAETHDFDTLKRVLMKLNEKQVREVCGQCADRIFIKLISNEEFSSYAIPLWTYIKNLIPDPVFERTLHSLWRKVFNPEGSELTKLTLNNGLLRELWSGAPESVKLVFVSELFANLDSNFRNVRNYDLTFMFELLENVDEQSKKKIWSNNWHKLIIRANTADLKKLKQWFSVHDDDKIDLSGESNLSKLKTLSDYFNFFVNDGLYSELCECLSLIARDPTRLETLSREIIFANLPHISACDDEELAKLHSFINSTSSNPESAFKFIEEFVSNAECLTWIYSRLDEYCFEDVVNLSIRFPTSEKNLAEVKRGFLTYCFGNFAFGHIMGFDGRKFNEFLSWCCVGEEKAMVEMKNSLNIDDIFETVLDDLLENLISSKTLNREVLLKLDEFLDWYFVELEVAKAYKSSIMLVYRECDLVKTALRGNADAAQHVYSLLNWGFGNE